MISLADACTCGGRLIDMTEELACQRCGIVVPKEPVQGLNGTRVSLRPYQYTSMALGTDTFVPPEDQPEIACTSLIERVCERQQLPKTAMAESVRIAKLLLEKTKGRLDVTSTHIVAASVVEACRVLGITRVAQKNVMKSLTNLGYEVRPRDMLDLQGELDSKPWIAEDHVKSVVARIASMESIQERLLRAQTYVVLSGVPMVERGSHNPRGCAGGAVYCAEMMLCKVQSRHKAFTQKVVASCADVEEYTIRDAYGELFKGRAFFMVDMA